MRTISCLVVAASGLSFASAAIDQAAKLSMVLAPPTDPSVNIAACPTGNNFKYSHMAVTVAGTNATLADVSGTYDAATQSITTPFSYMNIALDGGEPILKFKQGGTVCRYHVTVEAGSLLGVTGAQPVTESGVTMMSDGLDKKYTTGARCADMGGKYRAYVAYGTNATYAGWAGEVNKEKNIAKLTCPGCVPDPYLYVTNLPDGTARFGTHATPKGPWGCVYQVSVVDGSLLGVKSKAITGATTGTGTRRNLRASTVA